MKNSTNIPGNAIPQATDDGSYWGTMSKVQANQAIYEAAICDRLVSANAELKASKAKVSIKRTGNSLQIQATLPLKPGDKSNTGKDKKQYLISLGIPASLDGVTTALEEARELSKLIARHTFQWDEKYLGVRDKEKIQLFTFGEILEKIEVVYFNKREINEKSKNTLRGYLSSIKSAFVSSDLFDCDTIERVVNSIQNAKKNNVIKAINVINKDFELNLKLNLILDKYQVEERSIPQDTAIVNSFFLFEKYYSDMPKKTMPTKYKDSWKRFQWIYGMLATYGMRPKELFNQPDLDWWLSPNNHNNTWKVHKTNKTGYREIIPFVPEWIELFDLKNPQLVAEMKQWIGDCCDYRKINVLVILLNKKINAVGINHNPYDLRHACAIRAHMQGIPVKAAADNLGHTTEIHNKVYQRWFGEENRRKAFDAAFKNMDELEQKNQEIITLKLENERLKIENERLRLTRLSQQ
jgi:integrase